MVQKVHSMCETLGSITTTKEQGKQQPKLTQSYKTSSPKALTLGSITFYYDSSF